LLLQKFREIEFPYGAGETLHKMKKKEQRWGTKEEANCHASKGCYGLQRVEIL